MNLQNNMLSIILADTKIHLNLKKKKEKKHWIEKIDRQMSCQKTHPDDVLNIV